MIHGIKKAAFAVAVSFTTLAGAHAANTAKTGVPYPPPQTPGCHHFVNGVWQQVPCAEYKGTKDTLPFPPPQSYYEIQSNTAQTTVSVCQKGPAVGLHPKCNYYNESYQDPIVWGSVSINFLTDPTQATETDSTAGTNAFSIQTNTNYFLCQTCSNGYPFQSSQAQDQGWVQFVYQPTTYGLCVWNNDTTPNPVVYQPTCVNPVPPYTLPLTGKGAPREAGQVYGQVDCPNAGSNSGCILHVFGYLPWAGGWWHASAPDLLGLAGNWLYVNGTILGQGGASTANFQGGSPVKIETVVGAYACLAWPYETPAPGSASYTPQQCLLPAVGETFFPLSATDQVVQGPSGEANNLAVGLPTFECGAYYCWVSSVGTSH